jgi:hypothetical protein
MKAREVGWQEVLEVPTLLSKKAALKMVVLEMIAERQIDIRSGANGSLHCSR